METKPRTILPPKISAARRHVHSFVQSSLTPLNQDDFGKRKHNVAFEVEVCHPGPDKLVITAERDIHPGEELLSNYLEEEEEEEKKEENEE